MPVVSYPYNGCLPSGRSVYEMFIRELLEEARLIFKQNAQHTPSVDEFRKDIEANPTMVDLFNKAIIQASSDNLITSLDILLQALDVIVVEPPRCVQAIQSDGTVHEPVGVPIYLLLDLLVNTSAGHELFSMAVFNTAIKRLLDSWGRYLMTADSAKTLTNEAGGWFSTLGLSLLQADGRGNFDATYIAPDPKAINKGYTSWDAFFTRQIQPSARPVEPAPPGTVIYNACESTVERIRHNVQMHDKFWLKGMAYSLYDIFDGNETIAKQLAGGTVYQAFLSPQDYHRWHSPVAGNVVDVTLIPGTYYAALPDDGEYGNMRGAILRSQPWLTVAATRAIITIYNKNGIGLIAFIAVGMVEVSTCDIRVKPGDSVSPGTELGMFHFGGSSHAVVFGPQVRLAYRNEVKPNVHQKVNKILADVTIRDSNSIV
ncbi:phosphatidylserine decarboxylase, partial [Rhizoctonia solani]